MARRPDLKSGPARFVALVRSSVPPMHRAGLPVRRREPCGRRGRAQEPLDTRHGAGAGRRQRGVLPAPAARATRPGRLIVAPADGLICLIEEARPRRTRIARNAVAAHQHLLVGAGRPRAAGPDRRRGRRRPTVPGCSIPPNWRPPARTTNATVWSPDPRRRRGDRRADRRSVARRIVCEAKVGDKLAIGDTYGLIRYGSRLDTYLPAGSNILVTIGQRALGGETVLAELSD